MKNPDMATFDTAALDDAIRDEATRDEATRKFSNHRRWQDFVAAVHDSVTYPLSMTYPKAIEALRTSRAWFSEVRTQVARDVNTHCIGFPARIPPA
jgi:hypothetical protein